MGMKIVMKNKNKITIDNKKKDKINDKVKKYIHKDVTQWKGVGEGEWGTKGISYVKNLQVFFTYCIVANKIRLLSIW